jgi:TatA/E family protein of Tat protein translocase
MFGMGWPEIALIGVVAIIVFGPDKLPDLAKQAGRFVRTVRTIRPACLARSGRLSGPKTTMATTPMRAISGQPIPNMGGP